MIKLLIIIFVICIQSTSLKAASTQNISSELPTIYFGLDLSFGKYRETDYKQYLYGISMYVGMPIDRFLSAECYADLHMHIPNENTAEFWRDYFGISNRYEFGVNSFRIGSAGGRFNFRAFKYWNSHIGGGLGFFGFNPSINETQYERQTAILYEVEAGMGLHYDISKSLFIRSGVDFKIYFMENADRHEYALVFDIVGIGYKYYREIF